MPSINKTQESKDFKKVNSFIFKDYANKTDRLNFDLEQKNKLLASEQKRRAS